MRKCWSHSPEDRPSFRSLKEQLLNVSQGLLADWLSLLHCTLSSSTASPHPAGPPSPEACIFCASYSSGHPWIEICRAIQATRRKWITFNVLHMLQCFMCSLVLQKICFRDSFYYKIKNVQVVHIWCLNCITA
jgi:hypothetical protein